GPRPSSHRTARQQGAPAPARARRLRPVARGTPAQPRLAAPVGAQAAARSARRHREQACVQRPLRGSRAGVAAGHRVRVRHLRRGGAERGDQPVGRPARAVPERLRRLLDGRGPGRQRLCARVAGDGVTVRLRGPAPAPPPGGHHPPQPGQPPGRREAGAARRGRGRALPGHQRPVGGPHPLRPHRRGVGRARPGAGRRMDRPTPGPGVTPPPAGL
ncbi:MAG: Ribosomal-protein-S5p-alanine acetyltransferase, partial [uncultured Acidimicrobiales bacterium]